MQTFLPFSDFAKSARDLDRARLQKQLLETQQIMRAITDPTYGWQNHPAVRMWRGYPYALMRYQEACVAAWAARGWTTMLDQVDRTRRLLERMSDGPEVTAWFGDPSWLGHWDFHHSHRSNLVRKMPEFYAMKYPDAEPDAQYVWPVGRDGTLIYYRGHEAPRRKAA
jgi:hypothetical protein